MVLSPATMPSGYRLRIWGSQTARRRRLAAVLTEAAIKQAELGGGVHTNLRTSDRKSCFFLFEGLGPPELSAAKRSAAQFSLTSCPCHHACSGG